MAEDIKFVYKTYHPKHSASLFGEQFFLYSLIKDKMKVDHNGNIDGLEGAVINLRGNDNMQHVDQINADIAKLKWCVIVITGNEDSTGFYRLIKHLNCKIWVQTPRGSDEADYYLPFGYPNDYIVGAKSVEEGRRYDWFFAGQVSHSRRKQCVEVLRKMQNGRLVETSGFGTGLDYPEYVQETLQSKVIPCPGGPMTPDTFRVYEALESGCVPVLDYTGGHWNYDGDYWRKVFGVHPLPVIHDWKDFPIQLEQILKYWPTYQVQVATWWEEKKEQIVNDLFSQISEIR